MTTPTFSVAVKGAIYGNPQRPANTILPDFDEANNVIGTQAGQHQSKRLGTQFLAKGPDGALHWYKFAQESTFANPTLVYVGP